MTDQLELSFVTQHDPGSWAIRWFTHSDFSHVDIIMPSGERLGARSDVPMGYPPHTGVQIRPPDYAKFSRDERISIPCDAALAHEAYTWLLKQVGKPYDKSGLFRSFLFDDYQWRYDDKWWCSELAAVFLEAAHFPRVMTPANRLAPNDTFIYAGAMPSATWRKVL